MAFPTTRRSVVAAVRSDDPVERARSFERLAEVYWRPVYKTLRLKWKRAPDEAEDLCQAFFAVAFEKRWFGAWDPARGRFRTFLRTCLDRFVAKERRAAGRLRRGGGTLVLGLDFAGAEAEIARGASPVDDVFDGEWVRCLFGLAVDGLRDECRAAGKFAYFQVFERYHLADEAARPSYADVAASLSLTVSDVTNYLFWTRRALRRHVLDRLRDLTASDDEFRAEARAVLGIDP
jgi:RNA polymerase sigma-70 factor (ECF subfamily)